MEMLRQYLRRLVGAFAVVAIATFLLSLLMRLLPGDPIAVMVPNSTEDLREMMRKETGDSKESMRKDMYKFAGFLTVTVISAIGVFGAFVR